MLELQYFCEIITVHRKSSIHSLRHYCLMSRHFHTHGSICKPQSANTTNNMIRRCHWMKSAASKRICRYYGLTPVGYVSYYVMHLIDGW